MTTDQTQHGREPHAPVSPLLHRLSHLDHLCGAGTLANIRHRRSCLADLKLLVDDHCLGTDDSRRALPGNLNPSMWVSLLVAIS